MKTIKELADELGVSKQRVYRYIKKNHINEALQRNGVMYYDEAAENALKSAFFDNGSSNDAHHEAHQTASNDAVMIQFLTKQIELKDKQLQQKDEQLAVKDKQIEKLQQLLDQQQRLTLQAQNKGFFNRLLLGLKGEK